MFKPSTEKRKLNRCQPTRTQDSPGPRCSSRHSKTSCRNSNAPFYHSAVFAPRRATVYCSAAPILGARCVRSLHVPFHTAARFFLCAETSGRTSCRNCEGCISAGREMHSVRDDIVTLLAKTGFPCHYRLIGLYRIRFGFASSSPSRFRLSASYSR
jgi:hypothetical protein